MRFGVTASSPGLGGGGGGGGSTPASEVTYLWLEGASGQYYTGPAGTMRGADNFVVSLLYRPQVRFPDTAGFLLRAGDPDAGNGWSIGHGFNTLFVRGRDGAGGLIQIDINSDATTYWGGQGYRYGRDVLITLTFQQVDPGGGTITRARLCLNGVPPNNASDSTDAGFTVGVSDMVLGDTSTGPGHGIAGMAYYTGTVTDSQIMEHAEACYVAKKLVPGPISWDRLYSAADSAPAATWAPTTGTGNMTRTGAQLPLETLLARWA